MEVKWYVAAAAVVIAWYWSASNTRDNVMKTQAIYNQAKQGGGILPVGAVGAAVFAPGVSAGLTVGFPDPYVVN